jgi:hypothetical protein
MTDTIEKVKIERLDQPKVEEHPDCGHSLLRCPKCGSSHGLKQADVTIVTRDFDDGPGNLVIIGEHGLLARRTEAEDMPSGQPGNFVELAFYCSDCDPENTQEPIVLRIGDDDGAVMTWFVDHENADEDNDPTPKPPISKSQLS